MKFKYMIATVLLTLALGSCGKKEREMLQNRVDSLMAVVDEQNFNMDEMNSFMDKVADGLDSIQHQENIIYMGNHEVTGKKLTRVEIKQRIKDLGLLITRQKERIAELEDSMSTTVSSNSSSLKRIISNLRRQLHEKELTIDDLEQQLAKSKKMVSMLQTDINELDKKTDEQEEIIDTQDSLINEAYYIVGDKGELKDKGFTQKKGFKIWEKTQLKMATSQLEMMTKIDIREFNSIDIYSKKEPNILSSHPSSSYTLEKKSGYYLLTIKNAAEFWSSSRILVIQRR